MRNQSLSENIIVLTQSILIQGWQQTTSQTFHCTECNEKSDLYFASNYLFGA